MFRQLLTLFVWILAIRLGSAVQGQVRVIGAAGTVTARAGDDVTLPCRCEPAVDLTPLTVEWWQVELKTHPSRYSENGANVYTKHGGETVNSKNPKRTELFPDQLRAGNASLTLRHVTLSDNGKYTCVIPDLKTEESLQRAEVTLIVQPTEENKSAKNSSFIEKGGIIPLLFLVLVLVCALIPSQPVPPVATVAKVDPVTVEDVRLVTLNDPEPRPAEWDAGDATMQ